MRFEFIEKQYNNLKKDINEYNAWKSDELFDLNSLSKSDLDLLSHYRIVEKCFEGVHSERQEQVFNDKLKQFKLGLQEELNDDLRSVQYIILFENTPKPKNKLRSYKGLIKKNSLINYNQSELNVSPEMTIICLIAELNHSSFDLLIEYFFDDENCFIVRSNNNYMENDILRRVSLNIINNGEKQINYAKLIVDPLFINDVLYRIGGDDGETYWSFQKFIRK